MVKNAKRKSGGQCFVCFLLPVSLIAVLGLVFCTTLSGIQSAPWENSGSEPTDSAATILKVPFIAQNPDYPTGCESVSAAMALQYAGYDMTVASFIDGFLAMSRDFYRLDGELFGPDPNETFVGDPRSKNSYGCYAPVIERALCACLGAQSRVRNTTGTSLEELCSSCIDSGKPVLVWASIGMQPTRAGDSWRLSDGREFVWTAGEHCLVLVGYDDRQYYFNDPLAGAVVGYGRQTAESRYAELGMQSIVIE